MKKRVLSFVLVLCLVMGPFSTIACGAESWLWPVESCTTITSGRGYSSYHLGIDIPGAYGAAIRASKSGTVKTVYTGCINHNANSTGISCTTKGCTPKNNGQSSTNINWTTTSSSGSKITVCNYGNGNGVILSHSDGYYSFYAHMSSVIVSPGQTVKQGDIIGYIGDSGNAAGAHLHFTITKGTTNIQNGSVNNNPASIGYVYSIGGNTNPSVSVTTTDAKDVTETSATLYGTLSVTGGVATECGMYLGTSSTNMTKLGSDSINKSSTEMWYSTSKYGRTLSPGTTYYYEAYAVVGGKTYWGGVKSFKTDGDATVSRPTVNNVTVSGSNVTVSWSSVADATSYDAYLLQAPWGWEDIKYSKSLSSGITSFTFTNVKPGAYTAFVVARPNDNYTQSNWYDFTVDDVSISVKTDKSSYSLGEEVIIIPSYTGVSSYEIEISHKKNGTYVKEHSSTGMAGQTGYTPKNTGEYRIDVLASNGMSASTGWCYYTVSAPLPSNPKVVTDKSSYTLGETVTFTPSATDASRYTISVYLDGTLVFSNYDGFTGTISYKPTAIGNYKVDVSCINDSGFVDATNTFTVSSKPAPSGVSVKTDKESYTLGQPVRLYTTYTNADYYYFYVYTSENGREVLEQSFTSGYNSKTGDNGFTPTKAGSYKIKITAIGNGGETDAWCSFTVSKKGEDVPLDPTPENSFIDVPNGAYFAKAVNWAVDKGITSGTSQTTFSPNQPCTRAQAVTFLWRAAGSPEPSGSNTKFTDVPDGKYYTKAVQWAVEKGITGGTSANTFSPNDKCTRAQIVCFLHRFHNSPVPAGVSPFTDVPAAVYYSSSVAWAVENGITSGISSTQFGPHNDCNRGQIVTFLYRDLG